MIWLAIAACLLCSFVFSGLEAGILSVSRVRLKHRVKMKDPAAIRLKELLVNPERFLVTVVVVTNLMNITAAALATQQLALRLGWRGYVVALLIFWPVNLFLLEVLPKSLFRRFPYRALALLAEPLRLANLALWPMHAVGSQISRLLLRNKPPHQQKIFIAREDFKHFTEEGERVGTLSRTEREMIHNVIDFRAVTAREVMVPIESVHTIAGSATVADLVERSRRTNVERWPVTADSGQITGLVDVYDLLLDGRRQERVETYQRRMVRVAPNEPAYAVLRKMRAARVSLALVSEPAAAAAGVVTSADLVRRLVDTARARVETPADPAPQALSRPENVEILAPAGTLPVRYKNVF